MYLTKKKRVTETLGKIAVAAVAVLSLCFLLPLSFHAFTGTMTMPATAEYTVQTVDNVLCNVVLLAAFAAALYLLFRVTGKLSYRAWFFLSLGVVLLVGAWYLASAGSTPSFDSHFVTIAARGAAAGDYSYIGENAGQGGMYFFYYPFQLGYVLFCEIFIRLFFAGSYYVGLLQAVNLVCLVAAEAAMADTVKRLYGEDAARVALLLFAFCFQPVFSCTFVYGNIPAFAFSAGGVWAAVRFFREEKWRFAVVSGLLLALAVTVKMNCFIVLIATLAVTVAEALAKRRPSVLLFAAGALCAALFLRWFAVAQYEWRTGLDFGSGIPLTSWLAMGLNKNSMGYGWYTGKYTVTNFVNHGLDPAAASAASMEEVRARIAAFAEDPAGCNEFFTTKLLSQWNETSYQSQWNTTVRGCAYEGGRNSLAAFVCDVAPGFFKGYFDGYMQLLFPAAAAFSARLLFRRGETEGAILPLAVFGGMLYHLLFEAKSQYAVPYLLFLIPMAAVPLAALFRFAEEKIRLLAARK